jgi:hypothetical protein
MKDGCVSVEAATLNTMHVIPPGNMYVNVAGALFGLKSVKELCRSYTALAVYER